MIYSVAGAGPDKIDMKLEGGYTDPSTNCTIFTHIPPASNLHGAAHPVAQRSALSGDVTIAFYSDSKAGYQAFDWTDYRMKAIAELNGWNTKQTEPSSVPASLIAGKQYTVTLMTLSMSSAILSVPGGSVGELLVGYPSTALSTNASTESGRMQLRCYLGAALYKPEDVLILPDIAFEGIKSVQQFNATMYTAKSDRGTGSQSGLFAIKRDKLEDNNRGTAHGIDDSVLTAFTAEDFTLIKAYPRSLFEEQTGNLVRTNGGHLGILDGPNHYTKVFGTQTYDAGTQPLTHTAQSRYS
jgi:hypothetical protein